MSVSTAVKRQAVALNELTGRLPVDEASEEKLTAPMEESDRE